MLLRRVVGGESIVRKWCARKKSHEKHHNLRRKPFRMSSYCQTYCFLDFAVVIFVIFFLLLLLLVTEIFLIRPVSLKTGQGRDNENHLRYTENQKLSRYSETLRSVRYTENLITSKYTEILNFERCIGKLTSIVYPLIFETVYWSFRTFRKIDFDCLTVFWLYSVW